MPSAPHIRRVLASLLLVLLLAATPTATSPGPVASIQGPLTNPFTGETSWQTICTAFSIDEKRGLYMTAAHCLAPKMTLDGHIVWPVYVNEDADLAVLESRGVRRPALKPCAANAQVGTTITAIGHAYGLPFAMERHGRVAAYGDVPVADGVTVPFMVTDFALIGGMSGGPMVSADGCVVSINQMGNAYLGLGRPLSVIMAATRQFWS